MRGTRSLLAACQVRTADEVRRDRAAALGRIAGVLEGLLDELGRLQLRASVATAERGALAAEHAAVRAQAQRWRWYLLVQREANGLHDQGEVERLYPLPPPLSPSAPAPSRPQRPPAPRSRSALAAVLLLASGGTATLGATAPLAAAPSAVPSPPAAVVPTLRIVNALLLDGSGAPARPGALRISGDRIVALGELAPLAGEQVLDAGGLVLAPGFIDTHSHADEALLARPDALAAVSQGITTVIGGQDGSSPFPLAAALARWEAAPAAVNVAAYSGHGTLRERVLGEDYRRSASAAEVAAMAELLERDLAAGALGLSTGLEYDPGIYSHRDEVLALAKVAARHGGRYISHLRSEDRTFWEAIEEILTIGREAGLPVQISHLKLAMRSLWGEAPRLLARLDAARREGIAVSADLYPYLYWQSTLAVLFPARDFEDLAEARRVLAEIAPAEGLLLGRYLPRPEYSGRTVAEIAMARGEPPEVTLLALIRDAEALRGERSAAAAAGAPAAEEDVESVIGTSMDEDDLERLLAWPHANLCTDGELAGRHPRGFGSFPRLLGRYVRERGLLALPEAVRKMTSLAADHVGIADRGRLLAGAFADLVLFDPATVRDRATTTEPHALAAGIERVWVNGQLVFAAGSATGARPGRVLRRASTTGAATQRRESP